MTSPDLDEGALIAAVDLVGRTGATGFESGFLHDDVPVESAGWWAAAQYRGARVIEDGHAGPVQACEALAVRLLRGGQCQGCLSIVGFDGQGGVWVPDEAAGAVVQRRGPCLWRRDGRRWTRGCGEDPPATSTRFRLAAALVEAGAPVGMVAAARAGRYDDYLSDLALPCMQLVADLTAEGLTELAERAKGGEFDGTAEESRAWAGSADGQAAFAELTKAPGANRAERRAAKRRGPK